MPKAKAVVSEGALLGSIFGSLLVSMGFSWAADNMDGPGFGQAIYDLIQEHDEANKDTGVQLIRDLSISALTSGRPGTIQFNYAWTQAARSFAEWFQSKFFVDGNNSVISKDLGSIPMSDGSFLYLSAWDGSSKYLNATGSVLSDKGSYTFADGSKITIGTYTVAYAFSDGSKYDQNARYLPLVFIIYDGALWSAFLKSGSDVTLGMNLSEHGVCYTAPNELTAEKPQEVHYPDVADDGSQVYEVTYQGVTATDIEGIIQGAVDQILAGTAAIAGEVTQAQDVPAESEIPTEIEDLGLSDLGAALITRFPFSIPWDLALGVKLLAAPAEAPYFEVDFFEPISDVVGGWQGSTKIVLDFSEFEIIGTVCRWTSTIGFCLMLASSTKRFIWVA